jgi:hypothetical protein
MVGVIPMRFNDFDFLVEFVKEDASNYEYEGQSISEITASDSKLIPPVGFFKY